MVERVRGRATWLVSRAQLRAHSLLQEAFDAAGTRGYHYRILAALDEIGPTSQAEVGRLTSIDRSDVSVTLDALHSSGFIAREAHPSDRRQKLVSVTVPGRAELRRLDTVVDAVQEQFLGPLAADERSVFLELIARLAEKPLSRV